MRYANTKPTAERPNTPPMGSRVPNKCKWTYDSSIDAWNTSCDEIHCFIVGKPNENKHRYCPYCGKLLEQIEAD